ncbi:MAG: polyphosphate polymerase domain-containing protein [Magnetococcales bacterium]|nr:polyphosphate polymerase domain-containing protein [Magnetococcales bacterium]
MNAIPGAARFESKYLIDLPLYYRLRTALMGWCRLDDHSRVSASNRYLVRSLYFDTQNFDAYVEKIHGVCNRNKLRFRTYFRTYGETKFLKVEQKQRIGQFISKKVSTIDVKQYDQFMATGCFSVDDPKLHDFERIVHLRHQKPVTLVEYDREAWFLKSNSNVRLSFDHDVRYAESDTLFLTDPSLFKRDLSRQIVLEIKADRDDHQFTTFLVRSFNLKSVPNSKFTNAIEQTRNDLWL